MCACIVHGVIATIVLTILYYEKIIFVGDLTNNTSAVNLTMNLLKALVLHRILYTTL